MKKSFLILVYIVLLLPNSYLVFGQYNSSNPTSANSTVPTDKPIEKKPFKGIIGIFAGGSRIGADNFALWAKAVSNSGQGLKTTTFFNVGVEGFVVSNHFVYGFVYTHESLLTNGSEISPNRGSIAVHFGGSPSNPYNIHQIFFTLGIGYSQMNIKFHGDPPAVLQDPYIPNNLAKMKQSAFWLNPRVNLVRIIQVKGKNKFKVGLDAGPNFYFSGNYKYGYTYTYYTTSYYGGSYHKVSHSKFIGYIVDGVPKIDKIGITVSAFIGF